MAAFTALDHIEEDAFEHRWSRPRADETAIARAIVVDGDVAGTTTGALEAFLTDDPSRPLHARVATDNVASKRVLEKCGFRVIATERSFAQARSAEIEEFVLRLEEPDSPGAYMASASDRGNRVGENVIAPAGTIHGMTLTEKRPA